MHPAPPQNPKNAANAARLEELKAQHAAYEAELAQWRGVASKYAGGAAAGGEGEEGAGGAGEEEMDAALLEAHLGAGASAEPFTMGDALVDVRFSGAGPPPSPLRLP